LETFFCANLGSVRRIHAWFFRSELLLCAVTSDSSSTRAKSAFTIVFITSDAEIRNSQGHFDALARLKVDLFFMIEKEVRLGSPLGC
jgi:hypothetical protein